MTVIHTPYNFNPYPFQKEVFKAFWEDGKKHIMTVLPRRCGKDKTAFNILLQAALKVPGVYLYAFPSLIQASEAVWDYVDESGLTIFDHIPLQLKSKINNTKHHITLPNRSIIKMVGADNVDARVGGGARGIIFSEFMLMSPKAYYLFSPMIAKTKGFIIYPFTPRGMKNHAYDLFHNNIDNPEFLCMHKTIEQCFDNDGNRIYSDKQIDDQRKLGIPEEWIQQEYYCSWEAANANSIYAKQIRLAEEENRICDFVINRNFPVHTAWDIGTSDYTSIWFFQKIHKEIRIIYHYENNHEGMDFYLDKVGEICKSLGVQLSKEHWTPHDIAKQDFSSGMSAYQKALQRGLYLNVLPASSVEEGIARTRALFSRFFIHKTNCKDGLSAIKAYHREWKEKLGKFSDKPKHDWSSHAADAFRYLSMGFRDEYTDSDFFKQEVVYLERYR